MWAKGYFISVQQNFGIGRCQNQEALKKMVWEIEEREL
jgi:hypothetical protein